MNYFFIILGVVGFALAIGAYSKVVKLEAILKDKGILPKDWK
ncbi:MAG: hypothetical protein AB3N63_10590 [Puniceicoccaceae bacterium]